MLAGSPREMLGVVSFRNTELLVDMVCTEADLQREDGSFVLEERVDVVARYRDCRIVVVSCHRDHLVRMIFVLVSGRSYLLSHCHSHHHVRVRRSCCSGCYCLRDRSDVDVDSCVICRILYQSIYRWFCQSLLSQVPFSDSVRM